MKEKAMVLSVQDQDVEVIPLITDACLSCSSGCAKQGKPFTAINKLSLTLQKGSIVRIGASKQSEAIQGLFALIFPFISAIGGYFFASHFASLLKIQVSEGLKALSVLLCLFLSGTIVFFITRKFPFQGKPQVLEVY